MIQNLALHDNRYTQDNEPPEWFDNAKIKDKFDATPIINSGESPMKEILHQAAS